jgi:division/cell wall cluster transcriptional repressor MraZ
MFSGPHTHALDDKGRTMVPKDFRVYLDQLGERSLVMTYALGSPRRLEVRPAALFGVFQARFNESSTPPGMARFREQFREMYFGEAEWIEVDKAGRILIPAEKRRAAGLEEGVIFVGMGDERFQIWRPEDRQEVFSFCDQNADAIREMLAES